MAAAPWVIVIDDEAGSRQSMAIALERAGLRVRVFDDAEPALAFVEREPKVRLAVCDLRMPGMDGLAFLNRVRAQELDLAVILVTGFGTIESAVEAMRVGADDYLTKPVDLYELRSRVLKLIENWQLRDEVTNLREMLDERFGFDAIVGQSAAMEQLFQQMRQVAPSRASVLILGESGTGKELVAKALHQASDRRQERFLALNCGAIPNEILESELFGHEKGSFTGAVGRKIGKFRARRARDPAPGRDQRADPGTPGQAAAGARRAADHARRRQARCSTSTSGCWRPPTATWRRRSSRAFSGRTSTTGSRS